ncbi:MAG: hypothetical protein MRJ68_12070 [Nitrospira sp.]|nr:hypothetical protein [Nitrospira sp.]
MKNKIVGFEIPASDFQKVSEFYGTVFDWKIKSCGDQSAMAYTTAVEKDENPTELGGINGGFYKRQSGDESPSLIVETESIDKTLKAIEAGGGKVITPKHSVDECGFMADFADPEGNVLSLWQRQAT